MFNSSILKQDVARVQQSGAELQAEKRALGLRYLVKAQPGQDLAAVQEVFAGIHPDFAVEKLFPEDVFTPVSAQFPAPFPLYETGYVATLPGITAEDMTQNVFDLAYQARQNGGFVRVEPDLPFENPLPPVVSSDSGGPGSNKPTNHAWSLEAMRVRQAWNASARNQGRGVFIGHPDTGYLRHCKWGQGGIAPELGYNFMPGEDPFDPTDRMQQGSTLNPGHGMHTGSVMTFRGDIRPDGGDTVPSKEVTGVAPAAINVPVRCVSAVVLYPSQTEVARAIVYCVQKRCRVISLSLGGVGLWAWLGDPLQYAVREQVIVVAASGNYPDWVLPGLRFTVEPAKYAETIGVAGCTAQDKPWESSGRVFHGSVDIAAPSEHVYMGLSFLPGGNNCQYEASSGTSYATANMAGIAALWLGHHFPNGYYGQRSAVECFREHIKRTARVPHGWNDWFGKGIVDAHALLTTRPNTQKSDAQEMADKKSPAQNPLAGMIGAESTEAANALFAALLGGNASSYSDELQAHSAELAILLYQHPELRADLCLLTGALTGSDLPVQASVQATLRDVLAAKASLALKDALDLA